MPWNGSLFTIDFIAENVMFSAMAVQIAVVDVQVFDK
jgi:hypothetical protein